MKVFKTAEIRNVALIGHGRAGKTTLAEAALFAAGAVKRKGSVDQGTSHLDHDPEAIKRRMSLSAALAPLEWKGGKVNLIDTPGYFDFAGDVQASLAVADGAVLVLCAASGVEVGSELTWEYADRKGLPRIAFVNKLDRENADFARVVEALRERYGARIVPFHLPIGQAERFEGIIDLVAMRAYRATDRPSEPGDIPASLMALAGAGREALVEAAAAADDALTQKYLDDEPLTMDDLYRGLALGTKGGSIVPVLCGSALLDAGVKQLLDAIMDFLPSPREREATARRDEGSAVRIEADPAAPAAALVFKTMADPYVGKLSLFRVYSGKLRSDSVIANPCRRSEERLGQLFLLRGKEQIPVPEIVAGDLGAVAKLQETATADTLCDRERSILFDPIAFPSPSLTMAVYPRSKGDEEKISAGLARLAEEDPSFRCEKSAEAGELLVMGAGEMHLEVICARLEQKFGVGVELRNPKIPYRETVRRSVQTEYRHKKQSGGRGQYGHVFLEIEPLPQGAGFEFVEKIFGGAVPRQYIPAVEKGVRETMAEGVLAGFPVVDVRVTLYDGSFHSVDSSEMAFKIAASMAFKQGFHQADPVLLEPIMLVRVVVPESFMGDVMGDLNKKRGRIIGMDRDGEKQVIRAHVPLAELARYAVDLRSITQGRGVFEAEFDHYDEAPAPVADAVIEEAKAEVS